MRFTNARRFLAGAILVATVAACGGGGSGPGSDPAATVKDFFGTLSAGNWDKIPDYACAAQKDKVTQQFNPANMLGDAASLGVTPADAKAMVKFTVANLDVKEKSKDATKAVMAVSGKMKVEINKDKFKEIMKKALEAAGQPADDATLNLAMGLVDSLGQEQPLDTDVELVNEGGKWLICPTS